MSLDKSEELGCQYTRAYVLAEDNARLFTQISEINAWVDELEERDHVREEELAQACREHDRQRATAEHKAQVVEEQATELRQKDQALEQRDKALEAKVAELQGKEAELQAKEAELQREKAAVTTLTATLAEKDAALAKQEAAVRSMETALKEKETSLSTLQEQANTAQAQLEEAQEGIKGKYMWFFLKLILGLPRLIFVFSFRAEEGGGRRDLGEGGRPGRVHSGTG